MEIEEWYVGKSPEYIKAVESFVETFGEDADLERDIEPDSSDPDDNPSAREVQRNAVADFIHTLHPQDSTHFVDDALAELINRREIDRQDDEDRYGHLDEYGEPRNQHSADD